MTWVPMIREALGVVSALLLLVSCTPPPLSGDGGRRCASDLECDDGYFCNGAERCDPGALLPEPSGCVPGDPPCPLACDEDRLACTSCEVADADGDGSDARACGGEDCDDAEAGIHPGAAEVCNGRDEDCDGTSDEDLSPLYLDRDGDGWGDVATPLSPCSAVPGLSMNAGDCDDTRSDLHPEQLELCNGVDDDCSGAVDDGLPETLCALAGAEARCEAGSCTLERCLEGRGDCNGLSIDGCETSLETSENCNACGARCTSEDGLAYCTAGGCVLSVCLADHHLCDGACVSRFDVRSCADRCTPCEEPEAHGTATCSGYDCRIVCEPGYRYVETPEGHPTCGWERVEVTSITSPQGPMTRSGAAYSLEVGADVGAVSLVVNVTPAGEASVLIGDVPASVGAPSPQVPVLPGLNLLWVRVRSTGGWLTEVPVYVAREDGVVRSELRFPGEAGLGATVALSGDRLALGRESGGDVTLATFDGAAFVRTATIVSPSGEPVLFGQTLALSGDLLAVRSLEGPGVVYVFRAVGATWSLEATLGPPSPDANDAFGASLAWVGGALAVGCPGDDSGASGVDGDPSDDAMSNAGAVYLFRPSAGTWTLDAFIKPLEPRPDAGFGESLAAEGDRLLVGAPGDPWIGADGAMRYGGAYLFSRSTGTWRQTSILRAAEPSIGDWGFARAVALSPHFVAVGHLSRQQVLVYLEGSAVPEVLRLANAAYDDQFGAFLTAYEDRLLVGAPGHDGGPRGPGDRSVDSAGAAYLFRFAGGVLTERLYLVPALPVPGASFGRSLALDGRFAVVGAPSLASASSLRSDGGAHLFRLP